MKNKRFIWKNILTLIAGIITSVISWFIIGGIIVIGGGFNEFLRFWCTSLPSNITEEVALEALKAAQVSGLVWKIIVAPSTSVITGFVVGLMCATKPWLWGIVAIVPLLVIFHYPPYISLWPLTPYYPSPWPLITGLFHWGLILFISSFISYITFKTKTWYSNKKLKREERLDE